MVAWCGVRRGVRVWCTLPLADCFPGTVWTAESGWDWVRVGSQGAKREFRVPNVFLFDGASFYANRRNVPGNVLTYVLQSGCADHPALGICLIPPRPGSPWA